MARERKQFALRLDPGVMTGVERLAAAELRSVNAQIEVLLREALKRRGIAAPIGPAAGAETDPIKGEPRTGET